MFYRQQQLRGRGEPSEVPEEVVDQLRAGALDGLYLNGGSWPDLSTLLTAKVLNAMRKLSVSAREPVDWSSIAKLTALEMFGCEGPRIDSLDWSHLEHLLGADIKQARKPLHPSFWHNSSLRFLRLESPKEASPWKGAQMSALNSLELVGGRIEDLDGIGSYAPSLEELWLERCSGLRSIGGVVEAPALAGLAIHGSQELEDGYCLSDCSALRQVIINGPTLPSLGVFLELEQLEYLHIGPKSLVLDNDVAPEDFLTLGKLRFVSVLADGVDDDFDGAVMEAIEASGRTIDVSGGARCFVPKKPSQRVEELLG